MLVRVGSLMSRLRNGLGNIRISPTLGSLTWTGYNPDIGGGTRLLYPAPAALSWTTYAPSIALMIAVGVGAATYTGNAPTVTGVSQPSAAETLAGSETDALAIVYTDDHFKATSGFNGSVFCVDSGTPANDYSNSPTTEAASYFTYTSPSPKMILHDDGVLKYAAHNLAAYSEDFDSQTKTRCTVTSAATTAPVGRTQADAIVEDGTASNSHFVQIASISTTSGGSYKVTLKAKADTRDYVWLYDSTSSVGRIFDVSGGSLGSTVLGAPADSTITGPDANGFYDCTITVTASTSIALWVGIASTSSSIVYSGDSSSRAFVSGLHVYRYPADTTYLKTTSAARYADPIEFNSSGTAMGAMVEPQRTNNIPYSNTFSNAAWNKNATSVAQNVSGLFGTTTAWTLTATAGTGNHWMFRSSSSMTSGVNAIYAKAGTASIISMTLGDLPTNNGAYFNLSTGAVGTVNGTGWQGYITELPDGWYRCEVYAPSGGGSYFTIGIHSSDNQALNWSAAGTETVLIEAAQSEVAVTRATSPIETFASTVTRADDDISKAVTAYAHSATVNSGMVEYVPKGSAATATVALRWDDGTANEVVSIGHDASGNIGLTVTDGGGAQTAPLISGTVTNDATETIGFSWKANDFLLSDNGATAVADTSGTLPTVTTLKIGSSGGPIYVKRILIVPVEKTAAEVEAYGAL